MKKLLTELREIKELLQIIVSNQEQKEKDLVNQMKLHNRTRNS